MAATSIRVAYALFFFSFSMWIAILLSVCFQNGQLANPIQFPSYAFLGVFIVSAVASSVACMIIGFEYLGLGNEFAKRVRAIDKAQSSKVRLKATSIKAESDNLNGDYYVLLNQKEELEGLNLLVLINKKKREGLQVGVRNEACQLEDIVVINPPEENLAQGPS